MINEQIKQKIDKCINKTTKDDIAELKAVYDLLYSNIKVDYQNSRASIQFCIGQLQRINNVAEAYLMALAVNNLKAVEPFFKNTPSPSLNYQVKWEMEDVKKIMQMSAPFLSGQQQLNKLNENIADIYTQGERQTYVSFIIDSVSQYGIEVSWDKDTIMNHMFFVHILYSICHKDKVMDLFFNTYYNILDRLVTTGEHQHARDFAENLIMIGYDSQMLAEAYLGASKSYTSSKNSLAGLLYFNIALSVLLEKGVLISQRFAFDILLQILKIMRESRKYTKEASDFILNSFDKLKCGSYDKLNIYHTSFCLLLYIHDDSVVTKISDFLNENRECLFQNLEHSARPWYSLFCGLKEIFPNSNFSNIQMYESVLEKVIEREGGDWIADMYKDKNLSKHLKEVLVRLQSTRSIEDYSRDNHNALVLAKRLLTQSVVEENPADYILAMQPKSDYTFVKPENTITSPWAQVKIENVDGDQCHFVYEDIDILKMLVQTDENDIIMWIGKGKNDLHQMTLLRNMYSFGKLSSLGSANLRWLQDNVISKLNFVKDIKQKDNSIYPKSANELRAEEIALFNQLLDCKIELPEFSTRLLLAKDLEIACYPHQLLIEDRIEKFVGEMKPSCNIISTELLIKTNFNSPLDKNFTKSFWSPSNGEEFTFTIINSKLEDVFSRYQFNVIADAMPASPVSADLNIICAHGGKDIGETEWFYADNKPIIETSKIVGKGKLLILFVCHSGSMQYTNYDNAMHTIVKRYLRMGYSSVVAPMWSLSTEILPIWLSVFMKELTDEKYVVDAVYKANMEVKQEYISPSAWACLHLFGNPYLQIAKNPKLQLLEDNEIIVCS